MKPPAARLMARRADWQRAPSAHNTQPWTVTVTGDARLVIGWDAARTLPLGDPTGRDLMLSLGCVAEALAVVAADLGFAAHVDWAVDRAACRAGAVVLTGADQSADLLSGELLMALRERRTARGQHVQHPSADEVQALAGTAGVDAVVLPGALVDELLPVADRWSMEGPAADELAQWLRLDRADPRYVQDGLSDRALELSRPEAAGLRWAMHPRIAPWLRRTGAMRVLARQATVRPVGTVVALTDPADLSDEELAELGRRLLRLWLVADRSRWSAHPLSQLLDCPETQEALGGALGAAPYAVFRLGRPASRPVRSARLSARPGTLG
ncbi:hypothetical protein I6I18_12420 [Kytococcus sedentarius]|uniref:Nitroreductase family protein n=1 Tax=Kytococcus sedentarius (strain ATCC 14392 / DSM 20547 / JCM 11482 / CCUG 33030 / NBRC 15357 / NCTC 11040 / CCM 314 / 541) TaxID=478801 RepID=C7NJK0_KYTSD|nr:hypothetical protein [Kytococcus sedentarius]ACV05330.1 hypothetical protein Ksed_02470 [Kytococcus sedentarius DSM 20547]QQB63781.1 hypothetical protein I6I18_12420 [Kytococcus sedentarius]STX13257.1 Uncharacterised protein [Kytococcus sedentarius]